jgi:hypothetical protein
MDGSSRLQTFVRIISPLLGPATGTVAILAGLIIWNDFFTSLIFLSGSRNATLPVVIYGFVGANVSAWNVRSDLRRMPRHPLAGRERMPVSLQAIAIISTRFSHQSPPAAGSAPRNG